MLFSFKQTVVCRHNVDLSSGYNAMMLFCKGLLASLSSELT